MMLQFDQRLRAAVSSVVWRKRLPDSFGRRRVYVTPDSYMRYLWQSLARVHADLLGWVNEFVISGATVWDVGANVGVFTFAAARRAGPRGSVLAIEADPRMAGLLRRSGAAVDEEEAHVEVLGAAVADRVGLARFELSRQGSAANALQGFGRFQGVRDTLLTPVVTLDWLLDHAKPPSVVKIDVEGAEGTVIAGARRLLSEVRPLFICEVGYDARETVRAHFLDARYRLFDLRRPAGSREPLDCPTDETLAVPDA